MNRDVLSYESVQEKKSPNENSSLLRHQLRKIESKDSINSGGDWITGLLENLPTVSSVLSSSDNGDYEVTRPSRNVLIREMNGSMTTAYIMIMLSMSFAWGYSYILIAILTLPLECDLLEKYFSFANRNSDCITTNNNTTTYFVMLFFVAGMTQVFNPLVGKLSDNIEPHVFWGKRKPFILICGICAAASLTISMISRDYESWILFGFAHFFFMVFINIAYSIMIALISDLVPISKIAQANGILICLMFAGGLFGFVMFYVIYEEFKVLRVSLYFIYLVNIAVILLSVAATVIYVQETTHTKTPSVIKCESSEFDHIDGKMSSLFNFFENARKSLSAMGWKDFFDVYVFTPEKHGDFFYVILSESLYFMGVSFLSSFFYYRQRSLTTARSLNAEDTESETVDHVNHIIIFLFSGAVACYPTGWLSDLYVSGARKPFLYLSCFILCLGTISTLLYTRTPDADFMYALLGGASGGYLAMQTSLAADVLENLMEDQERREQVERWQIENELVSFEERKDVASNSDDTFNATKEDDKEIYGSAQLMGICGMAGYLGTVSGPVIAGLLSYFPLIFSFPEFIMTMTNEIENDNSIHSGGGANRQQSFSGLATLLILSAFSFSLSALVIRLVRGCR